MDAKLTLKLDKEVIKIAKAYVSSKGTSLSKFIEEYLKKTTGMIKVENVGDENVDLDLIMNTGAVAEPGTDYIKEFKESQKLKHS